MKKSNSKTGQYRQGDVFIKKIDELPKFIKLNKVKEVNGKLIYALGEKTGHHHHTKIMDDNAVLYTDENGNMWLEAKSNIQVDHEEHETIPLEKGFYSISIQREYSPSAIRNVAD
jgi:hypothetical protein